VNDVVAVQEATMKTNYVLIDYENVQPQDIAVLDQEHFRVLVFVGANQGKIAIDLAIALQCMGARAEYIRVTGNGPNALDFHIAFYIGQFAASSPDAYFHIISQDNGFDPLIQHLKDRKLRVCRSKSLQDIPALRATQATSLTERIVVIRDDLQKRDAARPRTVKTLASTINALFQKALSEEEIAKLIQELQRQQLITITDTKISYHFAI
jgi:hypothetical protein